MLIPDFRGFPEPQYTRMPNLIYDSIAGQLSLSQLRVLLFFVRATMGWRKDHEFVPTPISQIERVMGLAKHSVIDAIQFLEENHFITRRKTRGEGGHQGVTEYRLCFVGDADEAVLPGSKTLTLENPECKPCTLESVSRVQVDVVNLHPGADPSFSVFKENIKKENTPLPPAENFPNPSTEPSLDLEDDVIAFTQNAYSRENRRAKLPKLDKRAHQSLAEDLRRAESQWGPVEFRAALIAFLRSHDEWLRQNAWPLPAFLKHVDRYIGQSCAPAPRHARAAARELVQAPPPSPEASALPVNGQTGHSLPEEAEIWNELVTNGTPVLAFDWERQEGRDLRRCRDQARFSLDTWRRVCEKAQKALENECGWVTFRWLLKSDDNWWKVLQGEYDKFKPREKSKAQKKEDFITRKLRESDERRARKAAEAVN